jgi:hypothetical protein
MSFLQNLFKKEKDKPISNYNDFWEWFSKHERTFHRVVKEHKTVEKDFFNKLQPKLDELKDGYNYLTGMCDDNTVELILTPDGIIKNIVFCEELVHSAPHIEGWKFTTLKPALDIQDVLIKMYSYSFGRTNMSFYSNDDPHYPDDIDIVIMHDDLTEQNRKEILTGTHIFLDNYLGELDYVTTVDNISVVARQEAEKELIPIEKLKDFLNWRQKEFVEKYQGVRNDNETGDYSIVEMKLESGRMIIATVNTELLKWDAKASHPWILDVEIAYNGENNNGMPDKDTYKLLDDIEKAFLAELKDYEGYLWIGRSSGNNLRNIYFACKDFRKPSKLLHNIQKNYSGPLKISFDIYKDKYWKSLNHFVTAR